jgi:hypothetical protein
MRYLAGIILFLMLLIAYKKEIKNAIEFWKDIKICLVTNGYVGKRKTYSSINIVTARNGVLCDAEGCIHFPGIIMGTGIAAIIWDEP